MGDEEGLEDVGVGDSVFAASLLEASAGAISVGEGFVAFCGGSSGMVKTARLSKFYYVMSGEIYTGSECSRKMEIK